MMKPTAIIVILTCIYSCTNNSPEPLNLWKAKENMMKQANEAASFVVRADYENFVNYIYPPVLKEAGGKQAAIEMIEREMKAEILDKGGELVECIFYSASPIIEAENGDLQATLKSRMKVKNTYADTTYTLTGGSISVSEDRGKTWTFLDIFDRNIEEIRALYPKISERLKLPNSTFNP